MSNKELEITQMKKLMTICTVVTMVLAIGSSAQATIGYFEGFEDAGWVANQTDNWQNYSGGEVQRSTSGTSSSGSAHGIITNLQTGTDVFGNPSLGAGGPYTRFGGYTSDFAGGFTASLDVYLDTAWAAGKGFDYTVAINNQSNSHLRDYMFHVGVTDQGLLVNASNNTDRNFNERKLENENSGNYYTVATSGWYTLQQDFYNDNGNVSVDMILLSSTGSQIWNVTRTSADDIATTAGGHRYGWMTYNNIDGLAIDNVSMVPEPATMCLLALGGLLLRRKRRA